jgi:hypothetical protein
MDHMTARGHASTPPTDSGASDADGFAHVRILLEHAKAEGGHISTLDDAGLLVLIGHHSLCAKPSTCHSDIVSNHIHILFIS